jgi:hypothetical protein
MPVFLLALWPQDAEVHFAAGLTAGPSAIVISPDRKTVHIANRAGTVTPIATATNTPSKPTKVWHSQMSTRTQEKQIVSIPSGG